MLATPASYCTDAVLVVDFDVDGERPGRLWTLALDRDWSRQIHTSVSEKGLLNGSVSEG
jgi:hypothetical protein